MKTTIKWDYLGWRNSQPDEDPNTAQFYWNSNLLDMVNKLKEITNGENTMVFDTVSVHPTTHNNILQDMLFYRVKGKDRFIERYEIIINEVQKDDEIHLLDKSNNGIHGLIQIENLKNGQQSKS